jgi:hypothetical protein
VYTPSVGAAVAVTLATVVTAGCVVLSGGQPPQSQSKPAAKTDQRLELFRDWPKPDAVIVFSGQQWGYLEPCGCSPQFQKGGLARRMTFIRSLAQRQWPTPLCLDLGGVLDNHNQQTAHIKFIAGSEQAQAKMEVALEAMQRMRYTVMNVGPEDIAVPNGFVGLMGLLINIEKPAEPRGISLNLDIPDDWHKEKLVYPAFVRQVGNTRVGVVGVVGEKFKDQMADPEIRRWMPPADVLAQKMPELSNASDLQVLLHYGPIAEAQALAAKFPDLDVIIHTYDADEPTSNPEWANNGKTMLVTIGAKGKYTGAIGLFSQGNERMRYQLVPLDDRFDHDLEIRKLLDNKLIEKFRDLNLVENAPRVPFPDGPQLRFMGSDACKQCHPNVFKFWQGTRHAHALETLVNGYEEQGKRIAPGKHVNPECVSCHTTGFFYTEGYDGTPKTAHLGGNGCENCHGPGSEHVKTYLNPNATDEDRSRVRRMMRTKPQSKDTNLCERCHDHENDPGFEFDERWAEVEHGEPAGEDEKLWPAIREMIRNAK